MKRLAVLALILCFLLTACSTSAETPQDGHSKTDTFEENVENDTPSPDNHEDALDMETEDAATQSTSSVVPTFGATPQVFIDIMNDLLSDSDIVNAFEQEAEPVTLDDGLITYTYPITDGSAIILYEAPNTGELAQVFVYAESEKMDEADAMLTGEYLGIITACFAEDQDDLDALDAALQIVETGLSEEATNIYSNSMVDFMYIVSGGVAMLSVTPHA